MKNDLVVFLLSSTIVVPTDVKHYMLNHLPNINIEDEYSKLNECSSYYVYWLEQSTRINFYKEQFIDEAKKLKTMINWFKKNVQNKTDSDYELKIFSVVLKLVIDDLLELNSKDKKGSYSFIETYP